jgi:hypothetical protein
MAASSGHPGLHQGANKGPASQQSTPMRHDPLSHTAPRLEYACTSS